MSETTECLPSDGRFDHIQVETLTLGSISIAARFKQLALPIFAT
jgi:hypothetical protein